jgi:preprotein translocase subunit SecB
MTQAPLQLLDYWAIKTHVDAQPDFEPESPTEIPLQSLDVSSKVKQLKKEAGSKDGTTWLIDLQIEQKPSEGANIPYLFNLHLQGIVTAHPGLKGDTLQRAIHANGPALLFGAGREIIRATTSRGPYQPVIIPATNFLTDLPAPKAKKATKKSPKKKAAKKAAKKSSKK